jgi:hypothetical protein
MTSQPDLFDTDPEPTATEPVPVPGQRVAFTGGGHHWHGTVTRTPTGSNGAPRVCADVDYDSGVTYHSVDYRTGPHFRPTVKGEHCPDCGKPDRGVSPYSHP